MIVIFFLKIEWKIFIELLLEQFCYKIQNAKYKETSCPKKKECNICTYFVGCTITLQENKTRSKNIIAKVNISSVKENT